MKKVFFALLLVFAVSSITYSCTEEAIQDEQLTDPEKVCPPGQPDC